MPRFLVAYIGECCQKPHIMVVAADTEDDALEQMQDAGYDTGDVCTIDSAMTCATFDPEEDSSISQASERLRKSANNG